MAPIYQPHCFCSDDILELYEKTGNTDLVEDTRNSQALWHSLIDQTKETGLLGLILGNEADTQWAVVSQEPEAQGEPSQYRFTVFDRIGFLSHSCYPHLEQTVAEAFNCGYAHVCPDDTLDRLSQSWALAASTPSA